jgi:hypothetical protein
MAGLRNGCGMIGWISLELLRDLFICWESGRLHTGGLRGVYRAAFAWLHVILIWNSDDAHFSRKFYYQSTFIIVFRFVLFNLHSNNESLAAQRGCCVLDSSQLKNGTQRCRRIQGS